MYVIGIDGGGTKTRFVVGDLQGHILFDQTSHGSNIYSIGKDKFRELFENTLYNIKHQLNIQNQDIKHIYVGISGADLEEDIQYITQTLNPIFLDVAYTVENDAWPVLRSGLETPYGAVCICGTGTNSACINERGEKAILRALSYTLGTAGGGLEIARKGLHYAFRSEELTYKKTMLEQVIPTLFQKTTMEEIIPLFYPKQVVSYKELGSITPIVMKCADEKDEVSIMILESVAQEQALQTIGVMKQVNITDEIDVVVGGQVFQVNHPIFMEQFTKTIHSEFPKANIVRPKYPPVIGSYFRALDMIGVKQTEEINKNVKKSGVMYEED